MTDRDYQHSRPLDVHRWSEHKEANGFVDYVYDTYLNTQSNENQRIKKKHLKVVLLDLYVAWLNDPDLNIAVHMTPSAYSDGTVRSPWCEDVCQQKCQQAGRKSHVWRRMKASRHGGLQRQWKVKHPMPIYQITNFVKYLMA